MSTGYQAVVQIRPIDVPAEREDTLLALIQQNLPASAALTSRRDDEGKLLVSITLSVVAADTSEVQLASRDAVLPALERAGLSEQAALLQDINVRASS